MDQAVNDESHPTGRLLRTLPPELKVVLEDLEGICGAHEDDFEQIELSGQWGLKALVITAHKLQSRRHQAFNRAFGAFHMTNWTIADVAEEPAVTLTDWQVRELPNGHRHLVGFAIQSRKGRVSSLIQVFDSTSLRAVTSSGCVYQLYGRPGIDCYGEYVWRKWARLYQVTTFYDVSAEVWASHADGKAGARAHWTCPSGTGSLPTH